MPFEQALNLRQTDPKKYIDLSMDAMAVHCRAILDMKNKGAVAFDYGNNLRGQALKRGVTNAMDYPGSYRLMFAIFFVMAKDLSDGRPCRAIPRTSV